MRSDDLLRLLDISQRREGEETVVYLMLKVVLDKQEARESRYRVCKSSEPEGKREKLMNERFSTSREDGMELRNRLRFAANRH